MLVELEVAQNYFVEYNCEMTVPIFLYEIVISIHSQSNRRWYQK